MFKTYICTCCGRMFTHPDCYEVQRINGEPAHPSCAVKHHAKQRLINERIEYLVSLKPATEEESLAVQAELLQLIGKG